MGEDVGRICAFLLDGHGGGEELDDTGVRNAPGADGVLWIHLAFGEGATADWLRQESGLDQQVVDGLLAVGTRPHVAAFGNGVLVFLRGVNLNPGADPEDMVSIRVWIEAKRIISVRCQSVTAISDLRGAIAASKGPRTSGEFLVQLADKLTHRVGPVIDGIEDGVDDLEEQILSCSSPEQRNRLGELRRQAIALRRYLSPQREALSRLSHDAATLLSESERLELRDVGNGVQRYVEALDSARERAAVIHEEVGHALAEQTNRIVYLLSIVTALFLPLGLVTGLLGINVGGIPGAEEPRAFVAVIAALAVLIGVQLAVLRRLGHL